MKLTIQKAPYDGDPAKEREDFIGGSDAGAIFGLNPWKSAYTLWCEKTGQISGEAQDNDAMRAGRDLENYVAQRFTEATGKKVRKDNFTYSVKEFPFMRGHIDRRVIGENAILECKTAGGFQNKAYAAGEFPKHYYVQCLHYMAVTGAERAYLAVLCFPHFYLFTFDRDEAEIEALVKKEDDFWNCVEHLTWVEELDGSDSTTGTINEIYADSEPAKPPIGMPADLREEAEELEQICQTIKELTARKNELENHAKAFMEDAEEMSCRGWRYTWRTQMKTGIDTKVLKEQRPDIYEHYKKQTVSRVFRRERINEEEDD